MTSESVKPDIIVVGAGISGLSAALRLAEAGVTVRQFSVSGGGRAGAAGEPEGIAFAGRDDEAEAHFADTIACGAFLANQELPHSLCREAAAVVSWLDRIGVIFDRTPEGALFRRASPSFAKPRVARAGSRTGRRILSALESQARRYAARGLIERRDPCDFTAAVLDARGRCRGIIVQDLLSMRFESLSADAVIFCTGRVAAPFGEASGFASGDGAAAAQLFRQGAALANPEFVQWRPLSAWLGDVPAGGDVEKVHRVLGGLWIDDDHMTGIPGAFAAGNCQYQYHGAALAEGNALAASVFGGRFAAEKALDYVRRFPSVSLEGCGGAFSDAMTAQQSRYQFLLDMSGPENPHALHRELASLLARVLAPKRDNASLRAALDELAGLKERFLRLNVSDKSSWMNREAVFVRNLRHSMEFAQASLLAALLRDESRGVHQKEGFPESDDEMFLKTTKAWWGKEGPKISYEDVDCRRVQPSRRATAFSGPLAGKEGRP